MIGNIFDGDALLFLAQLPVYLISEETWIVGMTVGTSAPCWKGRNIGFQFDEAIYSLCRTNLPRSPQWSLQRRNLAS